MLPWRRNVVAFCFALKIHFDGLSYDHGRNHWTGGWKGIGRDDLPWFEINCSIAMLGGQRTSWRANEVGLSFVNNPGFDHRQLAYANVNQPSTLGRSIQADLDVTMQGRLQSSREFPGDHQGSRISRPLARHHFCRKSLPPKFRSKSRKTLPPKRNPYPNYSRAIRLSLQGYLLRVRTQSFGNPRWAIPQS